MVAQIKLRKLTGIKVGDNSPTDSSNFPNQINGLQQGKQIIFAGNDYKGDFKVRSNASSKIIGDLELELERPENNFSINNIEILRAQNVHSMSGDRKEATISLKISQNPVIKQKDSGYFTTELDGNIKSLKFSDWSDYDFPDKSYVDISFI